MTGSPFSFQAHEEDPNWYGPTRHGEFIICMDPETYPREKKHDVEAFFERLVEDGGRIPGVNSTSAGTGSPRHFANLARYWSTIC